mgnify:CR=1 FL=1
MKEELKVYDVKMQKTVDVVVSDFASVRAGRANASVLDKIAVDYYGSPTPINQVAAISSPDPRSLMIQPRSAKFSAPMMPIRMAKSMLPVPGSMYSFMFSVLLCP